MKPPGLPVVPVSSFELAIKPARLSSHEADQ
jgi:hypothetical protein